MSKFVAECYFLDVGQGTCQVIHLGGASAIVIDCGPSYQVLGDLLHRKLGISRIKALILSHNHGDHTGGLAGLVRQYRKSIDGIYLLQDKPANQLRDSRQFSFLQREYNEGNIPLPSVLIRQSENHCLYSEAESENSVRLELLFPTWFDNIDGQAAGNQNYTCGVMLLRCGSKRVLFAGDAEVDAWRSIYKSRGERPLECDVMAVPHHGGQIIRYRKKDETYEELHEAIAADLDWLYSQAITTKTAIISVGTANSYPDQHPLPPQIAAIRKSGACVMCTQITSRCSGDLERIRPGVLEPMAMPCQSRRETTVTPTGQSKDIACAGTVLVQIGPHEIRVEQKSAHSVAIDSKLTTALDHPLCRKA